jgi:SNF2 family DNA or RNA helicase
MGYTPRTTPKKHQRAAIEACNRKPPVPCPEDVFAYLMDMGTGKSKVVLDEWGELATTGGPTDLLLLAPKGSIRNWYADKGDLPEQWSELHKHCDPEFFDRLVHHTWVGDGKMWKERMRLLLGAAKDKKRPRALFINIEALSNGRNDEALKLALEFADQRGAHVVIDESTAIKGNSTRTDAALKIGEAALSKRILSGLWTPKSPMDLFYQCQFLDERILGQKNFFTFQRRYATVFMQTNYNTGRKFPQITGYQNLEELQQRVGRYSYRVLKKDCLDLEPKTYAVRDVELTKEQRQMLKEIRNFGHAAIPGQDGKFVTTDMVIKRIMREIQIGCGYVMDDEERVLHEVPENRTRALLEVLEEHSGKAIIWCPWRAPLDKIVRTLQKEYGERSVAQFHGGNTKTRGDEERRFLTDPECKYMCATQGAGMRGNTWTVADLTVYYANDYDLEKRDQSEDRNHRIGQTNRVTYVDLIAQGTIENKVVQSLRRKIDLATMINKEGHREWII